MEKKPDNFSFLTLANYTAPKIEESSGRKWVNYGEQNDYFDYLLDRYRGSPTNHTIINGVVEQIVGGGLKIESKSAEDVIKFKNLVDIEDINKWAFDLKWGGFYMQQIILNAAGGIFRIKHTPVQNWRSGKADENGEVKEYYYSDDWSRSGNAKYRPKAYPAYVKGTTEPISILAVKPYRAGSFYYPYVDYQGCLQYAHIEEEISNFHINNLLNGMFPSLLINFNNGVPEEEKQTQMETSIGAKWGGTSRTGKIVLAFNRDKESAATIEAISQPDLDKMFDLLSSQSTEKIMVGHRITSPMLFGIKDSTGLGNNADELTTASILFESTVIRPYRSFIIENLTEVAGDAGANVELEFVSYNPFADIQQKEELSMQRKSVELDEQSADQVANKLTNMGCTPSPDQWELIDKRKVDYDLEDAYDKALELATVVKGSPDQASEDQDNQLFLVRYVYRPSTINQGEKGGKSREFCVKMVRANRVYRKEDILAATNSVVNAGWGPHGADTYSIWYYKGGGNCHHFWQRQTYLRKGNKQISVNEARRRILELPPDDRDDVRLKPNAPQVAKRPTDMPNCGFLPSNKKQGCN